VLYISLIIYMGFFDMIIYLIIIIIYFSTKCTLNKYKSIPEIYIDIHNIDTLNIIIYLGMAFQKQ
jgi:hypothetical protein